MPIGEVRDQLSDLVDAAPTVALAFPARPIGTSAGACVASFGVTVVQAIQLWSTLRDSWAVHATA